MCTLADKAKGVRVSAKKIKKPKHSTKPGRRIGGNGIAKRELLLADASCQTPHVCRHVVEVAALWWTDPRFEHPEQRPVFRWILLDIPQQESPRSFHMVHFSCSTAKRDT